eukprot:CAMPEP_0116132670 /NCGR_PEP_ID=MMETSP0329-20121206/9679_1 /TAXON_ID=697910 /ORGANISM="Pseudo-nitzschia arenysensis, Strain B593" /LENGTH=332 /DNA_ID=CAMNT_0003627215 /DNA_START=131 /DNA_END=1129 /DNA_ORIENTATION=+
MAFGVESALPHLQDLHTQLPVVHQAAATAFSTHASPNENIIQLSTSIQSANNLLASSSAAAANSGDSSLVDTAMSLFQDYRKALDANPLRVKIITGCLLAIVGDAIAQAVQPDDYNKKRAAAFVAFDGVWRTVQQVTYGPIIMHCNGKFSSSLLGSLPMVQDQLLKDENVAVLGAIEQTLVSQLLLIPLLYYPIFYSVTGFVQDLTIPETIQRAKETFIPLMKRNLLFWIPVQFGAFYFVEENLQIPVLTACGLIWTVILSLSAGNVKASSEEEISMVEEKMVADAQAPIGVAALRAPAFFFGSNGDSSEGSAAGSLAAPSKATEEVGKRRK